MMKVAAASMAGATLEWHDFTLYNAMAALVFNHLFFPLFDPIVGTILAFSTYAVGYLSRPVGGIVFGWAGDEYGRKKVLLITLLMMGLSSLAIGLLPTYEDIRIAAPLFLVALRFFQGMALGGDWAAAVLLSSEHGNQRKRGLNGSFAQIGPAAGTLLATGTLWVTTTAIPSQEFGSWGWRIPFVLSVVLVGAGVWVRRAISETPDFERLQAKQQRASTPIRDIFRLHLRSLIVAGGVRIGSDVLYSLEDVARQAGVGAGTLYRHFPTREALLESVYRAEVEKLAAEERRLTESLPALDALRAWMLLFVDYIATKKIIAPALNSIVGGTPTKLFEYSGNLIKGAIRTLVSRAMESGDIRPDLEPLDLLRALVGVSNVASAPDWQQSARRLVDILLLGSKPTD